MKTLRSLSLLAVTLSAITLVYANSDGPPPGHTGAPGEETCAAPGCHDVPSNHQGLLRLFTVASPSPDTVNFDLMLGDYAIASPGDVWGFQLIALVSLNQPFGNLVVTDSTRTKITSGMDGRVYLSQTETGALGTGANGATWTFRWAAPSGTEIGHQIYFHIAGLIADGDGTAQGDAVVASVFVERPYFCQVRMTGDASCNGVLTSADILWLVSYVFRSGLQPCWCIATGDVNCDGAVTASDITFLVNHVFKSGAPPCDVCPLILDGTWDCS